MANNSQQHPGVTVRLTAWRHAAARVETHDRKRLEQLCRYITRPAVSDERVRLNVAVRVVIKLKTPSWDGIAHLRCRCWSSCSSWQYWAPSLAVLSAEIVPLNAGFV